MMINSIKVTDNNKNFNNNYSFKGNPIKNMSLQSETKTATSHFLSRFAAKGAMILAIAGALSLGTTACSKEDDSEVSNEMTIKGLDNTPVCHSVQDSLLKSFKTLGVPVDSANVTPDVVTTFTMSSADTPNEKKVWIYDKNESDANQSVYSLSSNDKEKLKFTQQDGYLSLQTKEADGEYSPQEEINFYKMQDTMLITKDKSERFVADKKYPGVVNEYSDVSLRSGVALTASSTRNLNKKYNAQVGSYIFSDVKAK